MMGQRGYHRGTDGDDGYQEVDRDGGNWQDGCGLCKEQRDKLDRLAGIDGLGTGVEC